MKEEYKECPNCHNMVDKLDTKCPYCLFSFLLNKSTVQNNEVNNKEQKSSTSFWDLLKDNKQWEYKLDKIIRKVVIIIITIAIIKSIIPAILFLITSLL